MQPGQMAYDRGITVFSPDGRLFQVEYAREAVKKGTTTIGIKFKDGVLLVVDKRVSSRLVEPESIEKIYDIDDYIGCALEGNPVDVGSEKPDILMMLLTSLIIGFIPAIITVSAMKSQLKTVGAKNSAADYTVNGSMRLTQNSDMFLYRNVNRVARPKESSGGGGGSSTHTSSSGRSHGGGGGRF